MTNFNTKHAVPLAAILLISMISSCRNIQPVDPEREAQRLPNFVLLRSDARMK